MRKLIIYILFLTITTSYSQELNLPVFTQYLADNNFVVSPTFAGIGDNLKIRANGLTQWVGIKGAPDNQSVYADFRIADRSGVGVSFYNDKNGNTLQTGAKFSFAHHLILDYYSKQYLSLGISYNINNFRIDIDNFNTGYENPVVDPFITDDRRTSNNNFDVGALYRNHGFYLSFNVNNLLPKNFNEAIRQMEPRLLLNYQIYSGYTFRGPKKSGLEFEPSVFYQMFSSDKRSSTDLNFKFRKYNRYEDYFWGGISYRFLNDQFLKPLNIGPMVGFKKSIFYFGYAYQVTTNGLSGYNSGTHVVTIGLEFLQGISNCPCTQSPVHN
ncbi:MULTISPECIES: PorP/SprF family type IX secretion system membrane protein [Aestuariibaculum]|uniref:Type IX secretion system membrane protein PorP/SprF n=1 Tax=Aestuariibaculum marinum TaxID=2683592 RepID=A0A8J6Q6I8_9FLAO|nr:MULTISPECIES: type IX secretion system membrane protein PorP/SprF [Aestuariibaculum]MBD0822546.1 type IX secretion system membrane protein PorP/SprF [Aestuariibaculum marinum]WMI64970.1 type IX secretion system membrane protein PorP/SprF [Aestuariibaculum sp. YM273]